MAAGIFGGAGGLIGDALAPYALISSPLRRISYLIPDVVIEELGTEDLAVTDHPVESGAAISDHAFKLPSRVEMRCGWSNSTAAVEGFVQQMAEALDTLQAKREPFELYTGKKFYPAMLLGRIAIETNAESENSLMAVLGLREVLITTTQTTGASNANQAMPEKTGGVSEIGTVLPTDTGQIVPGNQSIGLSPNAAAFGQSLPNGGTTIGLAEGGGSFGLSGPVGPPAFRI